MFRLSKQRNSLSWVLKVKRVNGTSISSSSFFLRQFHVILSVSLTHYVAKDDLEALILLPIPPSPMCWDSKYASPCQAR